VHRAKPPPDLGDQGDCRFVIADIQNFRADARASGKALQERGERRLRYVDRDDLATFGMNPFRAFCANPAASARHYDGPSVKSSHNQLPSDESAGLARNGERLAICCGSRQLNHLEFGERIPRDACHGRGQLPIATNPSSPEVLAIGTQAAPAEASDEVICQVFHWLDLYEFLPGNPIP
jgi:hypothetical protein